MKANSQTDKNSGLAHWMMEVPRQAAKTAAGFDSEAVHDLRVALRRCRSMADGFRTIDPDKNWKKMRRQATSLFDSLGALRDCHVLMEWVEKLGAKDDLIAGKLLDHLRQQEPDLQKEANAAIEKFDGKQWQQWTRFLPRRTERLPVGSEVFQTLALERLDAARRIQSSALRTSGPVAFHRLRIGLKKFRYVVENFLPQRHEAWKEDLKRLQDLLGEIHDLDVLEEVVAQVCGTASYELRKRWDQMIANERRGRVEQYRERMSSDKSLWTLWRSALPRGRAARTASLKRLQVWSSFLDSDTRHSRRVARFALQVYDGLLRTGVIHHDQKNDREILRAAAIAHEVGRAAGDKNHHKKTENMIDELDHLPGWTAQDVRLMARVARFHRGALPRAAKLHDLALAQRHRVTLLAGILRLANALDAEHDGAIRRVAVTKNDGFVILRADGLQAQSSLAETIAGARHLLETTCRLPVLVRPSPRHRTRRL
ncbi:MAG TPA: CHAD domain-containing protein [Candidatus Angelobacter sp.]|nr:CHAD domain-containing protein [Candidatus Angelobacter sp.]